MPSSSDPHVPGIRPTKRVSFAYKAHVRIYQDPSTPPQPNRRASTRSRSPLRPTTNNKFDGNRPGKGHRKARDHTASSIGEKLFSRISDTLEGGDDVEVVSGSESELGTEDEDDVRLDSDLDPNLSSEEEDDKASDRLLGSELGSDNEDNNASDGDSRYMGTEVDEDIVNTIASRQLSSYSGNYQALLDQLDILGSLASGKDDERAISPFPIRETKEVLYRDLLRSQGLARELARSKERLRTFTEQHEALEADLERKRVLLERKHASSRQRLLDRLEQDVGRVQRRVSRDTREEVDI